ncbi:MAG: glucose-6-phosphate isomerase [Desulfobacterales bacterium]|nr:glucose-6-phosphate isomerase [Desulfobacterales bacterium]
MQKLDPTKTDAWKKLGRHYEQMKQVHMRALFAGDKNRFEKFSLEFNDILLDYSKNIITDDTMAALMSLARELKLEQGIQALFEGQKINETENRSVLHTALRSPEGTEIRVDEKDIMPGIRKVLDQMKTFSGKVRSGEWRGYTGKPVSDIVNIGIGGSDLGPAMVTEALKNYGKSGLGMHFISNIDGAHLYETLKLLDPATTLFMIASKTFTTHETITNAYSARQWILGAAGDEQYIARHFVALSANEGKVREFGIDPENMFRFWDFVGGRFSIWSAIGLPVACYIGYDRFIEFLEGAHGMDTHFRTAPLEENMPVILALLGIWYNNFFKAETEAIFPYNQYLRRLPAYLQQASMESNGKCVDRSGNAVHYQTCPIIWGEPGTNGQHAFFQLIHQGTKLIPSTFIASALPQSDAGDHQKILLANFFSQPEALMTGKTPDEVKKELEKDGLSEDEIKTILPYKVFKGNTPSNSILLRKLTPGALGSLIALYEHRIFVQGIIWNIFSFDQWGVELGKQLADKILPELETPGLTLNHDSSTNGLIKKYFKLARP